MFTILNISTLNFYFSTDADIDRDILVFCATPAGSTVQWIESLDGFNDKYRVIPKQLSIKTTLLNEHDVADFMDAEDIKLLY